MTPRVPSFVKKQSKEHSFVILTRTTTNKQRRGDTNGTSFVHSSNLLVAKKGAQKQRGHLDAPDADHSVSVTICCKKAKKGQVKPAKASRLIGRHNDQSKKQKRRSCNMGGSHDADGSFLRQKTEQGVFVCRSDSNDNKQTKER